MRAMTTPWELHGTMFPVELEWVAHALRPGRIQFPDIFNTKVRYPADIENSQDTSFANCV